MTGTRSSKRRQLLQNECNDKPLYDRITDLPDAILHHILSFLPLKIVAQTSILSKRWRDIWLSFPDLNFTSLNRIPNTLNNVHSNKGGKFSDKETEFIYNVLSLRDKRFSDLRCVRFHAHLSLTCLYRLIRLALKLNVKELDVEVATNDYFNLPRCIVRCRCLRVLRLKSRCLGFRLPPQSLMASGFRLLDALSLSLVYSLEDPTLLDLFTDSSFPLLKKLSLDAFFGLRSLKIRTQSLQDLSLKNCFQLTELDIGCKNLEKLRITHSFDAHSSNSSLRICSPRLRILHWEYNALTQTCNLEDMKSLHEASISFVSDPKDVASDRHFAVSNFMSALSHAYSLTLHSQCFKILSNSNMFETALQPFVRLNFLELHTRFSRNHLSGLMFMFRSSPLLHTLVIKIIKTTTPKEDNGIEIFQIFQSSTENNTGNRNC